ncbi:MAG TPA: bifunctional enoyl-CoA hydratase/phosphate acetyltransferase [Bacteroidales bacterium]|nr:bifunctional enoyl-CoA hydratase/phosphate acetyltransferase [Bacteroidales bacterium]HRZ48871.1 bifunctional enoyl-CoA hydratase/phosphate acetyltransferase [Bacteroidales bacterium]
MLKTLDSLIDKARSGKIRRLAVVAASDEPVLEAVKNATREGIIEPVLTGDKYLIDQLCEKIGFDLQGIEVLHEKDAYRAAVRSVELIREGRADIMMKGYISTGPLLKAILDKEKGLRKGGLLSHIALYETPYYHKLLGVTDAAMNVAPTFEEKTDILLNAVELFHKLGITSPKVAVIGAVETVNPKMEATVHAAMLAMMNRRGQITGCLVDGPLAIDNAVSKEAAEHKGIISEVAGDADILVTPDINSGNVLYKTLGFLGGGVSAAVLMGATVPVVLTSRSDTERSKMLSIALAAAME